MVIAGPSCFVFVLTWLIGINLRANVEPVVIMQSFYLPLNRSWIHWMSVGALLIVSIHQYGNAYSLHNLFEVKFSGVVIHSNTVVSSFRSFVLDEGVRYRERNEYGAGSKSLLMDGFRSFQLFFCLFVCFACSNWRRTSET